MNRIVIATWLVALTLVPHVAGAQTPNPPAVVAPQKPAAPKPDAPPVQATAPRYSVGPDDLLTITVFDEPDLTGKYRVDADGFITFPLIGRVASAGVTIAVLQERLRSMLAKGYLRYP